MEHNTRTGFVILLSALGLVSLVQTHVMQKYSVGERVNANSVYIGVKDSLDERHFTAGGHSDSYDIQDGIGKNDVNLLHRNAEDDIHQQRSNIKDDLLLEAGVVNDGKRNGLTWSDSVNILETGVIDKAEKESLFPYVKNGMEQIKTHTDVAFDNDDDTMKNRHVRDLRDLASETSATGKGHKRSKRRKNKRRDKKKRRDKYIYNRDGASRDDGSDDMLSDSPAYNNHPTYNGNTIITSSRNADWLLPASRSNGVYFDTSGLKRHLSTCPYCMVSIQATQCPLSDQALEMKKWANELQELLSYGCIKPEGCTDPGICCVARDPMFEQTIVRVTQMLKDLYHTFQRQCSAPACPGSSSILSEWTEWGEWSSCDVTCGRGFRTRTRLCNRPYKDCSGMGEETAPCPSSADCCVNGYWSSWTAWGTCSATCGRGQRRRQRYCNNPSPNYCGETCLGQADESKTCGTDDSCCVDGNWATWSSWTSCSTTCGSGMQSRIRRCSNPVPNFCGKRCEGRAVDTRDCVNKPCCADETWNNWSSWSACSSSCDTGTRTRVRACGTSGQPGCTTFCVGERQQTKPCYNNAVDGTWGSWQSWSACSATCGSGYKTRRRSCNDPCGRMCAGKDFETDSCFTGRSCCVDGNWGTWQSWSQCSATCGRGERKRQRFCDNPPANYCGEKCPGLDSEVDSCDSRVPCQMCVDGNWGSWQSWSQCSVTCGRGSRERQRICNNPPPNDCGQKCPGLDFNMDTCDTQVSCQVCVDGNWGTWEPWSPCSVTCGGGSRERERSCNSPPANYCGKQCPGRGFEVDVCNTRVPCQFCVDGNWGSWQSWSQCSQTCGQGQRERQRSCNNPPANNCGRPCSGDDFDVGSCDTGVSCQVCVDGIWGTWQSWSECSATCGLGRRERRRLCDDPPANNCGRPCSGDEYQTDTCDSGFECQVCVDGKWGTWMSWSACSATCGRASRERRRICNDPPANYCGQKCPGREYDTDVCETGQLCEVCVDGNWSPWQSWTVCSTTCGKGTRERRRLCDNPPANNCGRKCPGMEYETGVCENAALCDTCVNGNWGAWQTWTSCSATCGISTRERRRSCDSPPSNYCGERCQGNEFETDSCESSVPCTICVDGNWGAWSTWSPCPTTCGDAIVRRTRSCDNPLTNHCGKPCEGEPDELMPRRCGPEAIDGTWSTWTQWTSCSATCGIGSQERSHSCSNPPPNACGKPCPGPSDERRTCQESTSCETCEQKQWTSWGTWGDCSATCGLAIRRRERFCVVSQEGSDDCGYDCPGSNTEELKCDDLPPCPVWGSWSACSVTCRGQGTRERITVTREEVGRGDIGIGLDAIRSEVEACWVEYPECPGGLAYVASWGQWDSWCPCNCRVGVRTRRRDCQRESDTGVVERVPLASCEGKARDDEECDVRLKCPACILSCDSLQDGTYPSCMGCDRYIVCDGQRAQEERCDNSLEYDAFDKKCHAPPSPSCTLFDCIQNCTDQADGSYHSCHGCDYYIQCAGGITYERQCATPNTEWNHHRQRCENGPSPTCNRLLPSKATNKREVLFHIIGGGLGELRDAPASDNEDRRHGVVETESMNKFAKNYDPTRMASKEKKESYKTGITTCKSSCRGLEVGKYKSCRGCNYYVLCTRQGILRQRQCSKKRQWDDIKKKCKARSSTCINK